MLLNIFFNSFRRIEEEVDEQSVVMKAITKCTKSLGKCSVEQTATLMAWSEKNNLPVDKYRNQVLKQLEAEDE